MKILHIHLDKTISDGIAPNTTFCLCSRVEVSAVDGGTSIKDSGKHVDGSCESRAERDMFRSVFMGECVCLRTHVHVCFYRPRAFHRAGPFVGLMKGWPQ